MNRVISLHLLLILCVNSVSEHTDVCPPLTCPPGQLVLGLQVPRTPRIKCPLGQLILGTSVPFRMICPPY